MTFSGSPQAARLIEILQQQAEDGLAVACSGGVDSSLLAWAAKEAGLAPLLLVFFRTPLNTREDEQAARALAQFLGLALEIVDIDVLALEAVALNQRNRCYCCKKALFQALRDWAESRGVSQIAEGSNRDDIGQYRPGAAACQELGVLQPLILAGLGKAEIQALAREAGLPMAERPASPCLASRFPYDTALSRDKLAQAEAGEAFLRDLGFQAFRLRCHDSLCRIELAPEQWPLLLAQKEVLVAGLKARGWQRITLDLEGFASGSFDH